MNYKILPYFSPYRSYDGQWKTNPVFKSSPPFILTLIGLGSNVPGDNPNDWVPPRPNAVMFTSVIDAWARTAHNNQEAVRSAERWLSTMEDNYFDKGMMECKPSAIAYTSVIMAYSRRGGARGGANRRSHGHYNDSDMISDAEKAEDVLLRLMERNVNFLDHTEIKENDIEESIDGLRRVRSGTQYRAGRCGARDCPCRQGICPGTSPVHPECFPEHGPEVPPGCKRW